MFLKTIRTINHLFIALYIGFLVIRWCGIRLFLQKILHQIYARWIYLVVVIPLDNPLPSSDYKCTVSLAKSEDIRELFSGLNTESPEGRYQLLMRKWYHELGIGDCYISRDAETNEICAVRWVITPRNVSDLRWEDKYPLEEDELTTENVYTFEKYRRLGVELASSIILQKVFRNFGYNRSKSYIDETNIPSLKMSEKNGDKICAKVLVRRFLFYDTRKILQIYDPPVTATEIFEMKGDISWYTRK